MKSFWIAAAAASLVSGAAWAQGNAEEGEAAFRQCQACHVVADADGNVLAGKAGKTGPNLFGVIGRQAGTVEGFRYGDDLVAAGEKGLVWDEETFVTYLADPTKFLRDYLDDGGARSKMTFKVRKEEDAHNLYAYIEKLSAGM